ncbi:MAG: PaaI family thioesterase [Candidatus Sifarchaeia archaeon]
MSEELIQDQWPEEGTFCWGCGKNNEHGLQLKSYWKDEESIATWVPKDYHISFPSILNGGIIATLIDCHGTGTANAAYHKAADGSNQHFMYVTGGISVKYLRPTPINKPITLKAKISEMSEKKIKVVCDLYSADMKCATGEVLAVRVDLKLFLKIENK